MNIVRKIHDQFRVKTLAGSTLQSPTSTSDSTGSGNTYVTITGGSLGGGGLSKADRSKLNSIEQGAQVNQDAFSKVLLETTNREQEQQTTTSSSIIANIPSDTANIRLVGNYPIKVSLESVSLFNYNTVTTTGDIVATYNVSYNKDGNIVIDYVSGTLFSTTDIEIIRIQHREETLATYNNTQFECTESEGTIIQFIIPYQGTNFSSIQFCRYETSSSESTEGTETVRELSVITELPVSPTKQQIITLSDTNANYWKYEEDENGNRYLWTDCNVYSTKEVSAYGKAEGQEMPTILNLSQLQDVALTNLSNNQVLVYNASSQKWVNIDANNLGISADNLKTLTITVNGTSYTYNPASSNQSINITTITLDDILPYISNKLDREEFFKWFTINYDSDNNVTSIQANYDFYSIKGISAYGLGDIGGITRTTLQSLDDVSLSNLVADNMLAYNGSKWVNIPMSQVRGVTSWADLENKPTTISGFGITDVYTKTEIDNKLSPINSSITSINSSKANSSIQIIAGTGLVGGGDLTANRTISLSTSGVSAGTYTKVTVDTYGRVTSGSTLSATDIPDLDWSKITSGKPTTLEGYGITDGVNSITITGSGNAITAVTISNHLLTFTKGETFLLKSTFDDLFEKVNVGTTSNPVYAIKAKYHLYSVGEVSAYEFGESGSVSGSLAGLTDVLLTDLAADSILKYNGSKWVNVPITEIKGATSWDEIANKPATFTPSAHTHTVADITDIGTKYVSISTTQTVSGLKTFTSTVKYQPTYYSYNAEGIEYRTTSGTLFGGIGAVHNGSRISYFYIGKGSTPWDTKDGLTIGDELGFKGYTVWHSGNVIIPTVPTKLSAFKNDSGYLTAITKAQVEGVLTGNITSHTHSYLPLSGGTMVGNARISHDGNLYIGNSSNSGWVALQDICSQNSIGDGIWSIRTNGDAVFTTISKVGSSDSYVLLGGGGHKLESSLSVANATDADMLDGLHANSFLLRERMTNPSSGTSYHGAIPFPISLKSAGLPLYADPEFASGNNNITVYNNSKNGTVTISRIADNQGSANSSGYILQISTTSGEASPGRGGFHQNIQSRQNAVFAQIFRAKIPIGFSVVNAENGMGNGYTTFWLTDTAGTGKWEWYIRITICGSGGNYSGGGHVYLNGSGAVTWYLAYCNVIDLTKGNYDGLRTVCADKLQTARTIWGKSFDGTGNVDGSLHIFSTGSAWNEGIRMHLSSNGWCGVVMCGADNTGSSGTSANTWGIHNNNGTFYINRNASNATTPYILCNINGNWGIGTNSPSVKLHVIGDIAATGEVTAKASSSDIRLKTDISDYKALSIIRSHKSIKYHWNAVAKANADVFNDDYWHYGLIAQDVQRDMPQMVSDVFKDYLVINYERLIPICWKGLQEVDDEVTKLKKRVKQLEKRLQKYESTEVFYAKGND